MSRAIIEWENEVQSEADRLIRDGAPPWDAMIRARDIVSERRRKRAIRRNMEDARKVNREIL